MRGMHREEVLADSKTIHSYCISACSQKLNRKDIKNGDICFIPSKQSEKYWICDGYIATAGGKANTSQLVVIVQAVFHSRFEDLIWIHLAKEVKCSDIRAAICSGGICLCSFLQRLACALNTPARGGRVGHLMI